MSGSDPRDPGVGSTTVACVPVEPYYDPEVRAEIEAGPRFGVLNARTLAEVRDNRMLLNESVTLSDEVTRTDLAVPGPEGAPGGKGPDRTGWRYSRSGLANRLPAE